MKILVAARRGQRVLAVGLAVAAFYFSPPPATAAFDLDDVAKRAHDLANKDFENRARSIPQWLLEITYDQWRDIRFRPDESHWRSAGLPFELQFFHCGLFYDRSVSDERDRRPGRAQDPVFSEPVRLRKERIRQSHPARPGLRGLPRSLSDQQAELQGRSHRLRRRELSPCGGERPPLRHVRARARCRHGDAVG